MSLFFTLVQVFNLILLIIGEMAHIPFFSLFFIELLTLNCKTTNVIYVLECNKCCLQYVWETTNNIYKKISGHKTTVNKEKTNNYLVQHCNNGMCTISDIAITILENLELIYINY